MTLLHHRLRDTAKIIRFRPRLDDHWLEQFPTLKIPVRDMVEPRAIGQPRAIQRVIARAQRADQPAPQRHFRLQMHLGARDLKIRRVDPHLAGDLVRKRSVSLWFGNPLVFG